MSLWLWSLCFPELQDSLPSSYFMSIFFVLAIIFFILLVLLIASVRNIYIFLLILFISSSHFSNLSLLFFFFVFVLTVKSISFIVSYAVHHLLNSLFANKTLLTSFCIWALFPDPWQLGLQVLVTADFQQSYECIKNFQLIICINVDCKCLIQSFSSTCIWLLTILNLFCRSPVVNSCGAFGSCEIWFDKRMQSQ